MIEKLDVKKSSTITIQQLYEAKILKTSIRLKALGKFKRMH